MFYLNAWKTDKTEGYNSLQVVFRKAALFMKSGAFHMKSGAFHEWPSLCTLWNTRSKWEICVESAVFVGFQCCFSWKAQRFLWKAQCFLWKAQCFSLWAFRLSPSIGHSFERPKRYNKRDNLLNQSEISEYKIIVEIDVSYSTNKYLKVKLLFTDRSFITQHNTEKTSCLKKYGNTITSRNNKDNYH